MSSLIGARIAIAADLPQVSESDPIAIGLKYKHDATQAPRADKVGKAGDSRLRAARMDTWTCLIRVL